MLNKDFLSFGDFLSGMDDMLVLIDILGLNFEMEGFKDDLLSRENLFSLLVTEDLLFIYFCQLAIKN